MQNMRMKMELDDTDRLLLTALQEDASQSLDQLSYQSDLSVASVQRRLKKLRTSGVIAREVAILDRAKSDYPMTFVVMVEMERERLDVIDAFKRAAQSEPQVQQCYYVTGEADFTLICTARDMTDFEALTHRLFFNNNNVRRFRTSVVMSNTKVGLNVPF